MGFGVCTRPVGDLPAQELSGYAYRRLYRLRAEYGYVVCCTGLCVLESVYNAGYMDSEYAHVPLATYPRGG